jgi:hypothetical protein
MSDEAQAGGGAGHDPTGTGPNPTGADAEQLTPEQEQALRQMEEEMRRVRVEDLVAQSVVSILNLSYRRIAKEDERDLEQARVGIEAVRAMTDVLDEEAQGEIRKALSQVQMLYAQAATEAGDEGVPGAETPTAPPPATGGEAPPRLWTPGQD